MKNLEPETLVIFRKWPNGQIIALFPLIPSDVNGIYCLSYEHVGQHGGADTQLPNTTPALPSEYADLASELRRIGYKLRIGSRVPRNAYARRRAVIEAETTMRALPTIN